MKCPHCDDEIELTWKRYWTSPFGRHACSGCGASFRLKHSLIYYSIIFSTAISLGLLFPLFRRLLKVDGYTAGIVYVFLCFIVLIPIDRWVDSKWRESVKVADKP